MAWKIPLLLIGSSLACATQDQQVSKRAVLPEIEVIEESKNDNRIDFFSLKSLVASPTLRETRKKRPSSKRPRNSPRKSTRSKTPPFNPDPFLSADDFFQVNFIKKQKGPECATPDEIVHGYDGDRRRGYKKLANGIFCNRDALDGSRCFLMCQRGSRLVTSMTSKKFRCKCLADKCTWTRPIQDVQCEAHFCLDTQILNGQMVSVKNESTPCQKVTHGEYCIPKCNDGFKLYEGKNQAREISPKAEKCRCPRYGACGFKRLPYCLHD